jgi:hypothetical protein
MPHSPPELFEPPNHDGQSQGRIALLSAGEENSTAAVPQAINRVRMDEFMGFDAPRLAYLALSSSNHSTYAMSSAAATGESIQPCPTHGGRTLRWAGNLDRLCRLCRTADGAQRGT